MDGGENIEPTRSSPQIYLLKHGCHNVARLGVATHHGACESIRNATVLFVEGESWVMSLSVRFHHGAIVGSYHIAPIGSQTVYIRTRAIVAHSDTVTVGGGCFWCIEAVYKRIQGVTSVVSGYAGGHMKNPTYEQVCSGATGHAEVARIEFDPDVLSLADLLRRFFAAHDPTTLNRQGNDVGTQYRSIVLFADEEQRLIAEQVREEARQSIGKSVVTEITQLIEFYPAEEYHQDYFARNPNAGYCRLVIAPKLKKLGM